MTVLDEGRVKVEMILGPQLLIEISSYIQRLISEKFSLTISQLRRILCFVE